MANTIVSILFDGLAWAMFLFIISVGLSVTMGLMGVVNLAHGAFAMAGGYLVVTATAELGRAVSALRSSLPSSPSAWSASCSNVRSIRSSTAPASLIRCC